MGINWSKYPEEKKQIKIKYLKSFKKRLNGEVFNLRVEVTEWAKNQFRYLKKPKKQFIDTFDHSGHGFFIQDQGFIVTRKTIKDEVEKRGLAELEYIDKLILIVKDDKRL